MASPSQLKFKDIQTLIPHLRKPDYHLFQALININSNLRDLTQAANSNFLAQGSATEFLRLYGTHAERLALNISGIPNGTTYIEYDRNALYFILNSAWKLVNAMMLGVMASRPSDLGTGDKGFSFLASDTIALSFWEGSTWIDLTTSTSVETYYSVGSNLTLTTSFAATNCSVSVTEDGPCLVLGVFDLQLIGAGDVGTILKGQSLNNGTPATPQALFEPGVASDRATVSQIWIFPSVSDGDTITTEAQKTTGSGSSTCWGTNTTLSVVQFVS